MMCKSILLKKNNCFLCWILTLVLTIVLFSMIMMLSGQLILGKYSFLNGDGIAQILEFASAFVHRLVGGNSLAYSFDFGLGMPMTAEYAFYAHSPFNFFYLIFGNIEIATFAVTVSKLGVAAAGMSIIIRCIISAESQIAVIFGVFYGLSGFALNFYTGFDFLEMLWIFPYMVYALYFFVKKGSWIKLCLIYAFSFCVQFYCAYIMGVCSFVIYINLAWYNFGRNKELWKKSILKYAFLVMVALLLSSPIILPAAVELFTYRADDVTEFSKHILKVWRFFPGLYPGISQRIFNDSPMMYAGLPTLLLVFVFFAHSGIDRRKKIFAIVPILFFILASFWGPLYRFMHAFDAPNGYSYRFSWMISFWLICIAAWMAHHRKEMVIQRYMYIIGGVLLGGGYFGLYFLQEYFISRDSDDVLYNLSLYNGLIIMATIGIYIVLFLSKKNNIGIRSMIIVTCCFELLMHGVWVEDVMEEGRHEREYVRIWQDQAKGVMQFTESNEKEDSWEFYRINYLNSPTDNISMLYGYHGLGYFSSIENENVRKFLSNCGYGAATLAVYDYGSTAFMRMILAQKYSVYCIFFDQPGFERYSVTKNENTLPLGFMVDSEIEELQLEPGNPFEIQNQIAGAMLGRKTMVYNMHEAPINLSEIGTEHLFMEQGIRVRKIGNESGKVTYSVERQKAGMLYAYMARWGISQHMHDTPLIYTKMDIGGMENLSRITLPHIIPVASEGDSDCKLYVEIGDDQADAFDYEALYFAYENKDVIQEIYDNLSPGGWRVSQFSDDDIVGNVIVSTGGKILFTSIPYDANWTAYVDGIKTEIIPVINHTFCSIPMEEGEHEVRFIYKSKWRLLGAILGMLGMCVFLMGVFNFYKIKDHK